MFKVVPLVPIYRMVIWNNMGYVASDMAYFKRILSLAKLGLTKVTKTDEALIVELLD